jgi:hypothetical protein
MGIEFMGALLHSSGLTSDVGSTTISKDDTFINVSATVGLSFTESNFVVITFTNNSSEDVTTIFVGKGESFKLVVLFGFPEFINGQYFSADFEFSTSSITARIAK